MNYSYNVVIIVGNIIIHCLKEQEMAKIREMVDQSQEDQTKEQLQFLISAAHGKLNEQKAKLEKIFLNPSAEERVRVIPDTQIRWYDEYRCNVKA